MAKDFVREWWKVPKLKLTKASLLLAGKLLSNTKKNEILRVF
jgi:hypothetical protein